MIRNIKSDSDIDRTHYTNLDNPIKIGGNELLLIKTCSLSRQHFISLYYDVGKMPKQLISEQEKLFFFLHLQLTTRCDHLECFTQYLLLFLLELFRNMIIEFNK